MKLGERVKNLRKQRRLTLDELSRHSGVAKGTLSKIENSLTTGTLKTAIKIAEALDLDVAELYRGIEQLGEEPVAIRSDSQETETFTYDERVYSTMLVKHAMNKRMLPTLLVLEPISKTPVEENPAGTEKFIFCLEGNLEVKVGEKIYTLTKGGVLYFKSSLPHFVQNTKSKPARCLSVTSPPVL